MAVKISRFKLKNPTSYKRGTAEMIIGDKSYFEMVLTGNFDGKVPANENEVAVEKDFLDKNGMKRCQGWRQNCF